MDKYSLEIFIDVARDLNFASVARSREIDPSQVSRTIQALEQEAGTALLARTTRRMVLTEAGATFLHHASEAVQKMNAAMDAAQASAGQLKGTVRITASVAFGERALVPLLLPMKQRLPDVMLDLVLQDDTVDMMHDQVDLAIRLAPNLSGDLIGRRLRTTRYRICASRNYARTHGACLNPQDLSNHKVVAFDLPGYRDTWRFEQNNAEDVSIAVEPAVIISSALAVRRAAMLGVGPALLADWLIDDALAAGELIDLFPDYRVTATTFDTGVWLAYPAGVMLSHKARAVADSLIELLAGKSSA